MSQQYSNQVPSCVYDQSNVFVQNLPFGTGQQWQLSGQVRPQIEVKEQFMQITLCDQALWNQFNSIGTEMVLNNAGRRISPSFRVKFSGLEPSARYKIMMDVERMDENSYKFQAGRWIVAGKGEIPYSPQVFMHPLSSSTGEDIMNTIVSFHKVKLTNSPLKLQNDKLLLHSTYRYQLRAHIARCDRPEEIYSYSFAETNFIAVTAYKNASLSQLKIANNPFARGFLPGGRRRRVKQIKRAEECDRPAPKRFHPEIIHVTSQTEHDQQPTSSTAISTLNHGHFVGNCSHHQSPQSNEIYYPVDRPRNEPSTSIDVMYPPHSYSAYGCIYGTIGSSMDQSNQLQNIDYGCREGIPSYADLEVNNGYDNAHWYPPEQFHHGQHFTHL